jgi:glyoxylase-like metal-dependent hydrolase (beta-lactamase superfamily II)
MLSMKMLKASDEDCSILPNAMEWRMMSISKVEEHIYLIDAETAGMKRFIASYALKGKHVAIVETGPTSSVPNVVAGLKRLEVELEDVTYVAVSHIHLDHAGGAGTLLKHLPNAKIIVHPRGAPHLAHPEKLWEQSKLVLGNITKLYGAPEPVPEDRIIAATDGQTFDIGNGLELKVVETLGHASHHQSYYEKLSQAVFPGDAAGIYLGEIDVIVPTTPPPLRLDVALSSLEKLIELNPNSLLYSHFGKASDAVGKLQAYEGQLRLWAKIAKQGLERKESLGIISKRIVESDAGLRKALDYVKVHPVLGATVLTNSVQGVVDFVEAYGEVA